MSTKLAAKLATAITGDRVGAVVVFEAGTTEDEARIAIGRLEKVDINECTEPQSFDPQYGFPVWYIP